MLFLHNKGQMYLPNPTKLFGSEYLTMDIPYRTVSESDEGKYYYLRQDFRLTQIHWKALDQESLRCDESDDKSQATENVTVSKCIVSYLEKEIGCSMGLMGQQLETNRFEMYTLLSHQKTLI